MGLFEFLKNDKKGSCRILDGVYKEHVMGFFVHIDNRNGTWTTYNMRFPDLGPCVSKFEIHDEYITIIGSDKKSTQLILIKERFEEFTLLSARTTWRYVGTIQEFKAGKHAAILKPKVRKRKLYDVSSLQIGDLLQFGEYKWRCVDVLNERAFLLSEVALFNKPYNKQLSSDNRGIDWEKCSLRKYLNGDFYDITFWDDEKALIQTTNVKNDGNRWYNAPGCNDTLDKIFLLSVDEVLKYFKSKGQISIKDFYGNNTMLQDINTIVKHAYIDAIIDDDYNDNRQCKLLGERGPGHVNDEGFCAWYLRTPGSSSAKAVVISENGQIFLQGTEVQSRDIAYDGDIYVRPAMWINTKS